jgi:hypothetical protein
MHDHLHLPSCTTLFKTPSFSIDTLLVTVQKMMQLKFFVCACVTFVMGLLRKSVFFLD